jgi:hypothetical protein
MNLLAEFQYRVVHIPGRTNPADFFTRKRFSDRVGPARHTGYSTPSQTRASSFSPPTTPSRPRCSSRPVPSPVPRCSSVLPFVVALQTALPSDPILWPLAAAAAAATPAGRAPTPCPASPSSFATGSSAACASAPAGSCGCRCSASSTRRRWAATQVGTRHCLSRAAWSGGRAGTPYVPARQGRAPAPSRSALPVASPDTQGRLHQPGLPRAPAGPLRSRLPALRCTSTS